MEEEEGTCLFDKLLKKVLLLTARQKFVECAVQKGRWSSLCFILVNVQAVFDMFTRTGKQLFFTLRNCIAKRRE